jgi:hypothetical protein
VRLLRRDRGKGKRKAASRKACRRCHIIAAFQNSVIIAVAPLGVSRRSLIAFLPLKMSAHSRAKSARLAFIPFI